MKIGDIVFIEIYGHKVEARILKIRPAGTLDVERLSDGKNAFGFRA